jgi:mannitol/fructose-specific phosphotransferase system IIA component (Ntr-type)
MTHKEFVSYFEEELFIPDLKARDKMTAIEAMVGHLVERKRVKNGKIVLEALRKRESLGSTGIGKSLAVPHGRTIVTNSLTVLFARSIKGIPWDALDGKPVHFIVLILAPHQEKDNHYLPLLGKVVEFARDANVRRKLMKVEDHAGMLEVLNKAKSS